MSSTGGYGPTVGIQPTTTTDPLLGTTTTVPGYTPDYASLVANDPTLKQIQNDLQAQGISDLGSRNAAINRYLVGFGQVPDLAAASKSLGINLGDTLDPTTAQLASSNPYSTEHNLSQQHTQALRQIRQGLAARGGLQSGELGYQLGQENTAYGQAQSDATQKLLDLIAGVQSAYTDAQRQALAQVNTARTAAADRQATLNPPVGSQTATYDSGMSSQAGHPVYRGPDGKYYNADGSGYVPTQTGAPDPYSGLPASVSRKAPTVELPQGNTHYFGLNF